ncbi:MAG: hypothetical protein LC802_10130 [Acidobacteria bacterium]|nr:hypothetical protein [Acidobacteriota bacterium]
MTKLKKNLGLVPLLALCLVVLGGAATFAQRQLLGAETGRPEIKVFLSGAVEREGKHLSLDKVADVQPGEILQWQIISLNEGTASASDYKAVGHIPAGTSFVSGSAAAVESGSSVTYSIDGGKTFATQPIIEQKQPDGTVKKVPAPVSMYTEVRYEWSDALAAGGKLSASYKVRVK